LHCSQSWPKDLSLVFAEISFSPARDSLLSNWSENFIKFLTKFNEVRLCLLLERVFRIGEFHKTTETSHRLTGSTLSTLSLVMYEIRLFFFGTNKRSRFSDTALILDIDSENGCSRNSLQDESSKRRTHDPRYAVPGVTRVRVSVRDMLEDFLLPGFCLKGEI
jgi:hypothetical protein